MALTKDIDTLPRAGDKFTHSMAAGVKSYVGGIAVLNAAGFLQPGIAATGLKAVGRFERQVDNTNGADGDVSAQVLKGCFRFKNSATNPLTLVHVETVCYIEDDQTVGYLATGMSVAGKVKQLDGNYVWVDFT